MFEVYKADLKAVLDRDPAARSKLEVVLTYSGFKALRWHRFANWLYRHKMRFLARVASQWCKHMHGIEIHPAAKIGKGVFIDHGLGVVIGETAEVGDNCVIYQGVTLGGTGKDVGKRHPTIKDNVMICAGAKVLGPITVGENCKIGAQAVLLKSVPPNCTVVGVPGRIVRIDGRPVVDMDQTREVDPVLEEFKCLKKRLSRLEQALNIHESAPDILSLCEELEKKAEQELKPPPPPRPAGPEILSYEEDYAALGDELSDEPEPEEEDLLPEESDENGESPEDPDASDGGPDAH